MNPVIYPYLKRKLIILVIGIGVSGFVVYGVAAHARKKLLKLEMSSDRRNYGL